ncbi:MAG: carboxymuconolactone decarboxylase family protein [Oligoflexia bacterium]|nr:carboxymuconolactone decarboxylase family protein [Oligoflexia bacterium]
MSRIKPIEDAKGKSAELLAMVQKKMGRQPNMMRTLAHSPAALELYLQMSNVLGGSSLNVQDRERLALLAAKKGQCEYCDRAHTAIATMVKVPADEIGAARDGHSVDATADALLKFSAAVIEKRGHISDADFKSAKAAGLSDAQLLDAIAVTCFNLFTNYINHVAQPEIDF